MYKYITILCYECTVTNKSDLKPVHSYLQRKGWGEVGGGGGGAAGGWVNLILAIKLGLYGQKHFHENH